MDEYYSNKSSTSELLIDTNYNEKNFCDKLYNNLFINFIFRNTNRFILARSLNFLNDSIDSYAINDCMSKNDLDSLS